MPHIFRTDQRCRAVTRTGLGVPRPVGTQTRVHCCCVSMAHARGLPYSPCGSAMAPSPSSIRVLHLLARQADFQTTRSLDALANSTSAGVEAQVAQVGRGGRWRNWPTAYFPLRSLARRLDIIQCWDESALSLAAAAATKARILYSPQATPTRAGIDWVRAATRHLRIDGRLPFGARSSGVRRAWRSGRAVPPDPPWRRLFPHPPAKRRESRGDGHRRDRFRRARRRRVDRVGRPFHGGVGGVHPACARHPAAGC